MADRSGWNFPVDPLADAEKRIAELESKLAECEKQRIKLKHKLAEALDPTWPTEAGEGEKK